MADTSGLTSTTKSDDRLLKTPIWLKLLRRPELGSISGLILVVAIFLIYADTTMFNLAGILNILTPSSYLGLLAMGAALLMIGGEFDLSIGSMVALSGLIFGVCVVNFELPLLVSILICFALSAAVGFINGQIVLKTKLPSFIVTLAFLFIYRGLTLVGLKIATGGSTQLWGITDRINQESAGINLFFGEAFKDLFAYLSEVGITPTYENGTPQVIGIPVEVLWFILFTVIITFVLIKTKVGNWIFAVGGDASAARSCGVPVEKVKTSLFIVSAMLASLVAILTVLDAGSTDARRGFQQEFEAIIAAVIGGCLLTGGYGSIIGAFFGSIIFGMVSIGLTYTEIDQDWYQVFLGMMLLIAVIFNNFIRKKITGEK